MGYEVTENSTAHGSKTPHGFNTPHKFPIKNKISFSVFMSDLAMQLYPTGRAFSVLKNSVMDKLHLTLNRSFIRILDDCRLTLDSSIPDNNNFTIEDCDLWEYRFGMIVDSNLTLIQRREAIFRRMARGRNVKARQGRAYLEYQLRLAGFDVYVFENGFIEGGVKVSKTPTQITSGLSTNVQHGNEFQHGVGYQHGSTGSDIIANSIEPDESFSVGSNLFATFFIGGQVLGQMAEIPSKREREFRELVLKIKPCHLVAFTFINFV